MIAVPAIASVCAILAGWWQRSRGTDDRGARRIAGVAIAGLSVTAGIAVFVSHTGGVSTIRALGGAVIASICGCTIPLTAYYSLGATVRGRVMLAFAWVLTLVPLYLYLLLVLFAVARLVDCPTSSSGCPV